MYLVDLSKHDGLSVETFFESTFFLIKEIIFGQKFLQDTPKGLLYQLETIIGDGMRYEWCPQHGVIRIPLEILITVTQH